MYRHPGRSRGKLSTSSFGPVWHPFKIRQLHASRAPGKGVDVAGPCAPITRLRQNAGHTLFPFRSNAPDREAGSASFVQGCSGPAEKHPADQYYPSKTEHR